MTAAAPITWIAFSRNKRIAQGEPRDVAGAVKALIDDKPDAAITVLNAVTSQVVELDLRGSLNAVLKRLPAPVATPTQPAAESAPRAAGRPKLGVTAREVTLLPRHWEWLAAQPGGASVALRKLVEHAQRANRDEDRMRQARDSAYRFMNIMAGNAPGFEEASRALFAGDLPKLRECVAKWPADVRRHALVLVEQTEVEREASS